ncbi:MAG: metallophosphoesterase [Candidatus Eremiobacteraeota bacterium]|nr:metallophosphoesterase [Candidatus Eremiobacteraeota bacterium]
MLAALVLAASQLWLGATDLHLDPFDRTPVPAAFGADSNLALFRGTLAAMRRADPNPAVVVLPGDFFMHRFAPNSQRPQAMRIVVDGFRRAFPRAQFVVALGNNDSACGDYRSELGSADLAAIARSWAPLVNRAGRAPGFAAEFARGGHYTANAPLPGLRFVVVDSIVFSSLYRGDCDGNADAAARELAWLDRTLASTPAGVRNVVVTHVPPGYDVFATAMAHGFVAWPLMQPGDAEAFVATLTEPRNRVALVITGHEHRFDVRVASGVPIVTLGSISPVYGNAPAFYALDVDDAGLQNVRAWAFDERAGRWSGPYDFDKTWGATRIDVRALRAIHDRLGDNPALRKLWQRAFDGWAYSRGASVWEDRRWRIPWCAQTELDGGFAACAGLGRRTLALQIAGIVALGAVAGAIALVLFWAAKRVRRRRGSV